jgi:hypothetical protein
MYEILQVLDIAGSYPSALLVCRLWYRGERFTQVGETTILERYSCTYYVAETPMGCTFLLSVVDSSFLD